MQQLDGKWSSWWQQSTERSDLVQQQVAVLSQQQEATAQRLLQLQQQVRRPTKLSQGTASHCRTLMPTSAQQARSQGVSVALSAACKSLQASHCSTSEPIHFASSLTVLLQPASAGFMSPNCISAVLPRAALSGCAW